MNTNILTFALNYIFRNWGLGPIIFSGLGIGAAIISHNKSDGWGWKETIALSLIIILISIIYSTISFAYKLSSTSTPKLKALRFVQSDGLNTNGMILIFSPSQLFQKDQILTLFCSSSGAKQPITLIQITDINDTEIQAVPLGNIEPSKLRKYYEEESRRISLFAAPNVSSQHILAIIQSA